MSEPSMSLTVHIDPATADYYLVREDGVAIGAAFDNATSKARENAWLWAAAPAMREALFFAMHALEDANEGYFCECENCEQCGKPVDECTGTECSKTCQCSSCRYCVTEMAYESAKVAFAAAEPPAGRGAGGANV